MAHGIIQGPEPAQIDTITDYTGLLPLECVHLYQFIRARWQEQPPVAAGVGEVVRPPLPSSDWSLLLEYWKIERMREFGEMLVAYDRRFLKNDFAVERATATARAIDMGLPMVDFSPSYDRRLMFRRRGEAALNEDTRRYYLDALSPLVCMAVQRHYYHTPSPSYDAARSLDDAIATLLMDTDSLPNGAKCRLVGGYILHCIRQHVASGARTVTIPYSTDGTSWFGKSMKFKFKDASFVRFTGDDIPPFRIVGDLTRPAYYVPTRHGENDGECAFFYLKPGRTGLLGKPTVLYRITVSSTRTTHSDGDGDADDRNGRVGALPLVSCSSVLVLPAGISQLTHAHHASIARRNQTACAPVTHTGVKSAYRLELAAMSSNGFPLLAHLRWR